MTAAASVVSGEVLASDKKLWREDAIKDVAGTTKRNAPGKQRKPKPDQDTHKKAVAEIEKEIEAARKKLDDLKADIAKNDPKLSATDGRQELRKRLGEIRQIQGDAKASRAKIHQKFDDLKAGFTRKAAELKTLKDKIPYKSAKDIDERINKLESDIQSGKLKLIEEKRIVTEINVLKKSRKAVEGFQPQQDAIEADKKAMDEVRKQLDDPQSKALSAEYKTIQEKLDELSKSKDSEYAARQVLFDRRSELQKDVDHHYNRKRALQDEYRADMNEWYKATQEERERKQNAYKEQKDAEVQAKRATAAAAEREAAEVPAFVEEIIGCDALLNYLQQYSKSDQPEDSTAPGATAVPDELPQAAPAGKGSKQQPKAFLLKKDDEEDYFVGGKYNRKNTGKRTAPASAAKDTPASTKQFKLPLGIIERFVEIKVSLPSSLADLPKTIEAVEAKKEWYKKESPKVTAENKAKVEAKIAALSEPKPAKNENGSKANGSSDHKTSTAKSSSSDAAAAAAPGKSGKSDTKSPVKSADSNKPPSSSSSSANKSGSAKDAPSSSSSKTESKN